MKSRIMIIAVVVLCLAGTASPQQESGAIAGIAGGVLLQDGMSTEPAFSVFLEQPLYSLLGESFIAKAHLAALYSNRPFLKAHEIYVVKGHYLQGVQFGPAYLAVGPGVWFRPNNKGDDWVEFAYAATFGVRVWRLQTMLYGDGVPTDDASLFGVQIGLSYIF